jgi:hypothetical protein
MLTNEQWRKEIVECQFPKFKRRVRDQGIATSCKADFAVDKKGGRVGRVTVEAWEIGDTTDSFVLSFLYGKAGQAGILMTRFRKQASGPPRRRRLLPPFSETLSREAAAKAFTLFAGTILERFMAKADRLRKKRRPPR